MNHSQQLSIQCREFGYLGAYKVLGTCCLSTVLGPLLLSRILYKSALFMQNKPNFKDAQMNVSIFSQMAYEYKHSWTLGENKPNQTQFKPNFKNAQNECKYLL